MSLISDVLLLLRSSANWPTSPNKTIARRLVQHYMILRGVCILVCGLFTVTLAAKVAVDLHMRNVLVELMC